MSLRKKWNAAFRWLGQSFGAQIFLLFVFVLIAKGHPIPEPITEYLYLPRMMKQYNPNYVPNDWTLASPAQEHLVFNTTFGWLGKYISMETVGWLGRILAWLLAFVALLRLGQRLKLPPWLTSMAIFFWLLREQSIVASEWAIGGFEAKVISYLFLFFSLDLFLGKRRRWGAFLLGLSFSFHPAVGLSAGLAVGFALLFFRLSLGKLLVLAICVILGALPGLVPTLTLLSQKSINADGVWEFVCLVQANQHLDPWSWPLRERFLVYATFLFNALHFRVFYKNKAVRFLLLFQVALALFFTLGLWWRAQEAYHLLRYFPFRLFPLFVLLCFFLQVAVAYHRRKKKSLGNFAMIVGVVCLMSMGNPLAKFIDFTNQTRALWKPKKDNLTLAFTWVRKNTPKTSVIIMPPWEGRTFHLVQRPQIANWWANRYDKLSEWKQRLEAMVGKIPAASTEEKLQLMDKRYNSRTPEQIRSIMKKYGGDYLVSKGFYPYPVVFRTPTYRVYHLKLPKAPLRRRKAPAQQPKTHVKQPKAPTSAPAKR